MDASKGNRKIDIELALEETEEGFVLNGKRRTENGELSVFRFPFSVQKIPATNPEKALENIRKKLSQWGDTIYNPISIDINLSQPYLIPASVLGEMKRGAVEELKTENGKRKMENGKRKMENGKFSVLRSPFSVLMSCHHCIRYANGLCPKETGKPTGPLFIRNGQNTFRLEFDCKKCLMYVCVND